MHALWRRLAPDGGVAALSARGARVAGGVLARREALARFAPRASRAPEPRAAERIELLLTTDLLSEGIDLRDASVVVHLDLPWTPARMEQRVGRSRRLGAAHACTAVYALAPPAAAESLLEVERRLREKIEAAGRVAGIAGSILPSLGPEPHAPSAARTAELLHREIAAWRADGDAAGAPCAAVARGARACALALACVDGEPVLAAALDGAAFGEDPATLLAAARAVSAASCAEGDHAVAVAQAVSAAETWLARRRARASSADVPLFRAAARRVALRRVARIAARAPYHRRSRIAPLAAAARRAVSAPFGIGAERVLETLAIAPLADEPWLRALAEFGAIHARAPAPDPGAGGHELLALVTVLPP